MAGRRELTFLQNVGIHQS